MPKRPPTTPTSRSRTISVEGGYEKISQQGNQERR